MPRVAVPHPRRPATDRVLGLIAAIEAGLAALEAHVRRHRATGQPSRAAVAEPADAGAGGTPSREEPKPAKRKRVSAAPSGEKWPSTTR